MRSEMRVVQGALDSIRADLFTDAFDLRPMAPLPAGHPLVRRAPGRAARYVRWLPHAGVTAFVVLAVLAMVGNESFPAAVVIGSFVAVPLLTTLFRPIGAWWLSLGAMLVSAGLLGSSPWVTPVAPSHLLVMCLVTVRTRPRVAAEMWLLTTVFGGFVSAVSGYGYRDDMFQGTVMSAVVLFVVAALRGLRDSKRQVAVQAAVTEAERSRRTVLEERTTIARELHDVVAHHMSVVAIQAEAAPYRVQDPPPELAAAFATIRENAVAALTELRRVLGVVRSEDPGAFGAAPPEAPQPTLADLDGLLANVREAGLPVERVTTGQARPLPQGVELSAYRIVQEALSNALRHAPGSTARVEVSHVLGGLGLRVVNGRPDRLAKPSPGAGHGLLGMRERVTMLGGEMTAEATPEGGYEIAAFLPVASGGAAA
ncbi:two-component sensor histidine kinase [Streptomyces cinnamoneus]|uniref:histidine kinase n=1 Tax=Streptomyces cinnamoneus TaxID=53446 RepID=A0A2G1XHV9_STRCJ|nr:histidine kinase [Streptomyces cinnamoneus]PHQ50807.1 two-component sensor histidine kinase [Streptomyces cinnamoneus]PPT13935.1 two-component sensor histidine kinase [Streptomyces cinnamoneus]